MREKILIAAISLFFLFTSSAKISTNVTDGGGDVGFNNPSNAQAEDGVFSVTDDFSNVEATIRSDTYGFAIPLSATIDSVYVEIKHKKAVSDTGCVMNHAYFSTLASGDVTVANISPVGLTLAWFSVGFSRDDFEFNSGGEVLTPAALNESAVGETFNYQSGGLVGNSVISVDAMRITVVYTEASGITRRVIH